MEWIKQTDEEYLQKVASPQLLGFGSQLFGGLGPEGRGPS